jgi:transaldolase
MRADGGNCEEVLAQFATAGINIHDLARHLQTDAASSFVKSWNELMAVLTAKKAALAGKDGSILEGAHEHIGD